MWCLDISISTMCNQKKLPQKPSPKWSVKRLLSLYDPKSDKYIEQCISSRHQRVGVWIQIIGLFITILSIGIGTYLTISQGKRDEQEKIDSRIENLYRAIGSNQVMYANYDIRKFERSSSIDNLPFIYIITNIDGLHTEIQKKMGMVNYQFLMFYIQQNKILNDVAENIHKDLSNKGFKSQDFIDKKRLYIDLVDYLNKEKWNETKFNYTIDSECIMYIMRESFVFINDERNKLATCNSESLNRIYYHFGYFPVDTPIWMKSLLRDAVMSREDIKKRTDIDWRVLFE